MKPKSSTKRKDKKIAQATAMPLGKGDILRYSIGEVVGVVFLYHFARKIYYFSISGEIHFRFRFGYEVDGLPAAIISLLVILLGGFLVYLCSYELYRHVKGIFSSGKTE